MVCKEWYNEIAWVWKQRITISLKTVWNKADVKKILKNSRRYYENIKIEGSNIDQISKPIKLLRSRDSSTFKNHIKNVIFTYSLNDISPLHIVDIFTALGNQLISVEFPFYLYESDRKIDSLVNIPEIEALQGVFNNLQILRLGSTPPHIATFCRNLIKFGIRIIKENDGPIFDKVAAQNVNNQDLRLHVSTFMNSDSLFSLKILKSLELSGLGLAYERIQKALMDNKFNELRSLSIDNCIFDNNDLKLMQIYYKDLEMLDLKYTKIPEQSRSSIFQYCLGLRDLKELKLEVLKTRDYQNILKSYPVNESLIEIKYSKMIITKIMFIELIQSTPNLRKLSFFNVDFKFGADELFSLLKNLKFLGHLVLNW